MAQHKFYFKAVADAIDAAGGVAAVAAAFGFSYQTVREWHIGLRRLPGSRCHALAKLAGVPPETLRPDLVEYWRVVRESNDALSTEPCQPQQLDGLANA